MVEPVDGLSGSDDVELHFLRIAQKMQEILGIEVLGTPDECY